MSHVVATIYCNVYGMEFSVKNCCCFAQYLLLCCKRPVMRRMAMLGPPLLYGCTVWLGPWWLAGVDSWTLQVRWLTGIEVICT